MIREEIIGDCRLILGDCREILSGLDGFDAVVSDPPYGVALNTDNGRFSGGHNPGKRAVGSGTANGRGIVGDDRPFDPRHLLALPGDKVIWGWNNFPDLLPKGACLVWLKRNDGAFGSFLSDAELAWLSRGTGVYCRRDLTNNAITNERLHPTQKPVGLMEWCLDFLPKATCILDPYMGSGSTGVACVQKGRRFIGVEIDPGYFDAACRRIDAAVRAPRLFVDEPAKPVQTAFDLGDA